jgi:hypothetical protein
MASFWSLHSNRRKVGNCHLPNQDLVYLYFFSDNGLTPDCLFCACLLDEHQTLYSLCKTQSAKIFVKGEPFIHRFSSTRYQSVGNTILLSLV